MAIYGFNHPTGSFPPLAPLPPDPHLDQQVQLINDLVLIVNSLNSTSESQIYADDSGLPRVFIGYRKDWWGTGKSFGILVSNPGINVTTAASNQMFYSLSFG